ncbi:proclotting enzyme-like [Arctopsyche grandis]|uniref:proclotting enzyme-like n=1 Tax=Arctopsyche grandis TaxID=121162 RepID=UPI00406D659A
MNMHEHPFATDIAFRFKSLAIYYSPPADEGSLSFTLLIMLVYSVLDISCNLCATFNTPTNHWEQISIKMIIKTAFCYLFLLILQTIECRSPTHHQQSNGGSVFAEKQINFERSKRFISFGRFQADQSFQPCMAPGNRTGHCKYLHNCFMSELSANLVQFINTFCRIENSFIPGICCPDQLEEKANLIQDPDLSPRNDIEENEIEDNNVGITPFRGCGISSRYRPKIVGGQPADPKEWPWMVALLRSQNINFCGGALVTNRHIISAAHCTNGFKPQDIRVRLGEYDFTRDGETNAKDFRVINVKEHPEYNAETFQNDISMLVINRPVRFDDSIRPICLPTALDDFANKMAIVAGWGTQGFGGPTSDVLLEVDIPIWPQDKCEAAFPQIVIPETTLCAGALVGRKDSCQGDSGGPLMHQLESGRWITVGIVSTGLRCGQPGRPGLYTRVNQYLPWIVQNTLK